MFAPVQAPVAAVRVLALVAAVAVAPAAHGDADADPHPRANASEALRSDRIVILGVGPETLAEREILALEVELSHAKQGWIGARPDLPGETRAIGALPGAEQPDQALFGSALQAVARTISEAHAQRGLGSVEVDVRAGTSQRRTGARSLVIELRPLPESLPGAEEVPNVPERGGANALLVTVRSVAIEGLDGLRVSEEELLETELELAWDSRAVPEGWIGVPRGHAARRVRLWTLGGYQRGGTPLYGSALQQIVDALAAELSQRGIYGARVDLAPGAIRHLARPASDGLLTLQIERLPTP